MPRKKSVDRTAYSTFKAKHLRVKNSFSAKPGCFIVIPKKFGKAVERNKLRRRIKEALRMLLGNPKKRTGKMMIFPDIELKKCSFHAIKAELLKASEALKLLS